MRLSLKVEGLNEARGPLRSLALGLEDPRDALVAAADAIGEENIKRLLKGRASGNAPSTRAKKRRLGQPEKPFIATGDALRSLRVGAEENKLKVYGKSTVIFGTKYRYMNYAVGRIGKGKFISKTKLVKVAAAEAATDALLSRRGNRRLRSSRLA